MPAPPTGPDPALDTAVMHAHLDRWRAGDRAGADGLLRAAGGRPGRLARRMLRWFPRVGRRGQFGGRAPGVAWRGSFRTPGAVRLGTTRDSYNLAAVHIRRELLDLARRYRRREDGTGLRGRRGRVGRTSPAPEGGWRRPETGGPGAPRGGRPAAGRASGRWSPLAFYHGWTRAADRRPVGGARGDRPAAVGGPPAAGSAGSSARPGYRPGPSPAPGPTHGGRASLARLARHAAYPRVAGFAFDPGSERWGLTDRVRGRPVSPGSRYVTGTTCGGTSPPPVPGPPTGPGARPRCGRHPGAGPPGRRVPAASAAPPPAGRPPPGSPGLGRPRVGHPPRPLPSR